MDVVGRDPLQQAEQYLKEGKTQSALPLLAGYVKQHPNSAKGWWLLSFVVPDAKQQIECLERALRLDPQSAPVRSRLEKLKGTVPVTPAFVPPFVDSENLLEKLPHEEEKTIAQPPLQVKAAASKQPDVISGLPRAKSAPVTLTPAVAPTQPPPQRKKKNTKAGILVGMGLFAIVILGAAAFMIISGFISSAQMAPPSSLTQILLPPTWTPTPTPTLLPSITPAVPPALETPTNFITPIDTLDIPKSQVGPYINHYAPNFTLMDVYDGNQVSLNSYTGNVVLVLFWTTWCDYCEAQMSALQMIYQTHKDKGLTILAVDVAEKEALARDFGKAHSLTFNILLDADSSISTKYEVVGFPTLFILDRSGVITYISIGMTDYWKMNTKVGEIMGF